MSRVFSSIDDYFVDILHYFKKLRLKVFIKRQANCTNSSFVSASRSSRENIFFTHTISHMGKFSLVMKNPSVLLCICFTDYRKIRIVENNCVLHRNIYTTSTSQCYRPHSSVFFTVLVKLIWSESYFFESWYFTYYRVFSIGRIFVFWLVFFFIFNWLHINTACWFISSISNNYENKCNSKYYKSCNYWIINCELLYRFECFHKM